MNEEEIIKSLKSQSEFIVGLKNEFNIDGFLSEGDEGVCQVHQLWCKVIISGLVTYLVILPTPKGISIDAVRNNTDDGSSQTVANDCDVYSPHCIHTLLERNTILALILWITSEHSQKIDFGDCKSKEITEDE